MRHIENQFAKGMTWANFRRDCQQPAEIDHIIPLASFDMRQESQRRSAMNFRNCRPAWQPDNRSKGDRMPDGSRGRDAVHPEEYSDDELKEFGDEFDNWE